jgi:signal transduction histidine kinase
VVHLPRTIDAALLGGFLVIFAIWLTSTFYFTQHLTSTQQRNAAMHARYARGQQLLSAVRSQVLLGSIYIRDALIEADQSLSAAAAARDQLRSVQAQVSQELQQFKGIIGADSGAQWPQLEAELDEYWQAAARLVAVEPDWRTSTAEERLHSQVIPRRDVILELSDDVGRVMDDALRREQEEVETANHLVRRRIWETTGVAVLVGIAIAGLSTWHVRRLETAVRDEHAEVARNRLELQHLSGKLVRAQEDERRSIARELHDEIGQALTAVDVELAVAEDAVATNRRAVTAIGEARVVVRRALGGVRDLSQLLRPSMLDDFGLPETLKWYLRKFSDRTGVRTQLVDDRLDQRLPIDLEVCVYRAIQEALTNVSRHAQATTCRVVVQRQAAAVIVTVEDDGVGLPAPAATDRTRRTGLGLVGIRERVSDLGGTFRIEGQAGSGTRLTIELPLSTAA